MPIPAGSRIGPYEIVSWLGAGGMGQVYRARDARLARDVAIKLISDSVVADRSRLNRFEQEARAAGQLNHPNILAVYDVGSHEGSPYIVSELLEGESLGDRLRGGAVSSRKAVDYARQIALGLAAAHSKGIVHRDVKPDNLFVTNDGQIKILDFGIAKLIRPDEEPRPPGLATETAEGVVVGTAAYMSPEQLRGEPIDARSDIFSFGAVLYEMAVGQRAFARTTAAETVAAILKEDPPALRAPGASPALTRIVSRCVEKTREARFQSARDLAFALESLSEDPGLSRRQWRVGPLAIVGASLVAGLMIWTNWPAATVPPDFAAAGFSLFTNWPGNEEGAEISPDGKLVAFLSDSAGEFDIWLSQVGTGVYRNLTLDLPPLGASGSIVRKLGFSSDSSQIWFNPGDGRPPMIMAWTGETRRPLLPAGTNTPAWSPDGTSLVYVDKANSDDPIYLADQSGANARQIFPKGSFKNVNPVWSLDNRFIYFTRGAEPQDETEMDVWRLSPSGGEAQRVTTQHLPINFLTPLDLRRLLYVARAEDRSGPWLWTLDVNTGISSRIPSGVGQYTSVSASHDGRKIVATVANPSASLWRVPVLPGMATENNAQPYPLLMPTGMAFAPRFGRESLFYLSDRGANDGLWKVEKGVLSQIRRSADGALTEPPAVSSTGQLAVAIRKEGRRYLSVMAADGTNARPVAPGIEIDGAAGQGAADWSPDGTQIVAGGHDKNGPALFRIPVNGGAPVRLLEGKWVNPIWSPRNDLIIFAGRSVIGQVEIRAIHPDGSPAELAKVLVRPGGYRFLPDGSGLVYIERIQSLDFSLLNFATGKTRQLTRFANNGVLRTFDVTQAGRDIHIVFDRSRQNSNIVLIELNAPR